MEVGFNSDRDHKEGPVFHNQYSSAGNKLFNKWAATP